MITIMIGETEIRAMHGDAAALPVLCVLALSNMPLSLAHLATATGYKRTAVIKAVQTLRHLSLAGADEPRPGDLRNIRMLTSFQLPLPGPHTPHTLPAGTASPSQEVISHSGETPALEGGPRHIGAVLQGVAKFEHSNSAHGVGGGGYKQVIDSVEIQQHQTTLSPNSRDEWRVRRLLRALGVWPNAVDGIAGADLTDVLGWIAYSKDPANGVTRAPALIAANLKAGRESGGDYRPFRVCRNCHHTEPVCDCGDKDPYVPDEYDQLAFQPPAPSWGETAAEWLAKRWYCPTCFGHPCQCQEAE